jgi:hypothetical protein
MTLAPNHHNASVWPRAPNFCCATGADDNDPTQIASECEYFKHLASPGETLGCIDNKEAPQCTFLLVVAKSIARIEAIQISIASADGSFIADASNSIH